MKIELRRRSIAFCVVGSQNIFEPLSVIIVGVMNPRVFLSHASEDKERFVLGFDLKLRGKGVDVWLDKWEILPGDSLVEKIFEEGIKGAQAVIVVVSKNSADKVWVREELNAAVVRNIEGISKLIPVVIDDCVVPEALRST